MARLTRIIRKYFRDFMFIVLLGVAAAGVAAYVLSNERLRFPLLQPSPFKLKAEFSTAQAVTPGQGQTVRVSGVRIGDISGVDLKDGKAIVTMDIDPEFKGLVHTNATALLRPKTGLKDMFVELSPGDNKAPTAQAGWTLPIRSTLPDVNPDQILAALDNDTRDYLKLLLQGAGQGLAHRGHDLQEVFARFEPTHRDLARLNGMLAKRHGNLSRLIHALNLLNTELATQGPEIGQLVRGSAQVFRAFASEQANIQRSLTLLPPALRQTTRTLGKVRTYANVLGPTARRLRPTVRAIDQANRAIIPFVTEAGPIIHTQIRPFVRDLRPLVRDLRPAAQNLATATPDLTRTFVVFNHLFNMLGYNPNGREGPDNPNRDEGYLFWLAWLAHNGLAVFATADANGPFRALTQSSTCQTLATIGAQAGGAGAFLNNLTPILQTPGLCSGTSPLSFLGSLLPPGILGGGTIPATGPVGPIALPFSRTGRGQSAGAQRYQSTNPTP